jgi:hypothetical protein
MLEGAVSDQDIESYATCMKNVVTEAHTPRKGD